MASWTRTSTRSGSRRTRSSPEFDRLNAQAGTELDAGKRADLIVQCQKLMADSGAFVWLTYDVDLFASKAWLTPAIMPTGSDWQFAQFST